MQQANSYSQFQLQHLSHWQLPSDPQQPSHIDLLQGHQLPNSYCGLNSNNPIQLPADSVVNPGVQCDPSIFRCTLSAIPDTPELLAKSRLPLGIHLQAFRDVDELRVLQTNIIRCRRCRAYFNPYVYLPDAQRWKCNICYQLNDLPAEVCWNPATCSYDPTSRPELHFPTVEYIVSNEGMLRPPPTYVFLFDVGSVAVDTGYLHVFSEQLLLNLERLPGGDRALISFIGVDSAIHFFQFTHAGDGPECKGGGVHLPKQLVISAADAAAAGGSAEENPFPAYDGLLVPLKQFKESIRYFVQTLPSLYDTSQDGGNCMGAALSIAKQMIGILGRITVLTARMPNVGLGALGQPPQHHHHLSGGQPSHASAVMNNEKEGGGAGVGPRSDFYKCLALDCTAKQITVDLFLFGSRPMDVATMADICKYSSGTVYHFPNFHLVREQREVERFRHLFSRYLTRKLGLEAVLRVRCSQGLSLHSFYGNFFQRSPDLLMLANLSPDMAIGAKLQIDEKLGDDQSQSSVVLQAAILYTSSKGDRRIRVHTLCLPLVSKLSQVFNSVDMKASVSLLGKMAVERVTDGAELSSCREALVQVVSGGLKAFNKMMGNRSPSLLAPIHGQLKFFPLMVLGMLKNRAFSEASKQRISTDSRVLAMLPYRSAPLEQILLATCPLLFDVTQIDKVDPQLLPLSYASVGRAGVYLMDSDSYLCLYVGSDVSLEVLNSLLGVNSFARIDEELPLEEYDNPISQRLHLFLTHLQTLRGYFTPVIVIREDSCKRELFAAGLLEDRTESAHSYVEFLHYLKRQCTGG